MGWAVGWDSTHGRWKGYGVPAYCDADGCMTEIDRGMGWGCECELCSDDFPDVFLCGKHAHEDVTDAAATPEHPEWIEHLLTDESWAEWRKENPRRVTELTRILPPAETTRGER